MRLFKRWLFFLLIVYTFVYMFLICFFIYDEKQTTYDILSNKLYFDKFLIVDFSNEIKWSDEIFNEKCRVFIEINENYRALIKDSLKWTPPMLSGYYPTTPETGHKAVVGKSVYENSLTDGNSSNFVEYSDLKFEIVGVIDSNNIPSVDNLIILFGLNPFSNELSGHKAIIDAKYDKDLHDVVNNLKDNNPNISFSYGQASGTSRFTKTSYYFRLLYIQTFLLTVFTLVFWGHYWFNKYYFPRKTYFLLGIPPIRIVFFELMEVLIVNAVSLTIALFVCLLLNVLNSGQLKHVFFLGCLVSAFSFFLIPVFSLLDYFTKAKEP